MNVKLVKATVYTAFMAIVLGVASASAQESVHVLVRGTTDLDPAVVAQMSGVETDPNMSESEMKKRLETTGLFSYVQVVRSGRTVYIRVRQKFTLFLLPYVSSDYTGTYYSLTAGKQIVFGEDALAVAHYQIGTDHHDGFVLLHDGAVLGSPFVSEIFYGYENALHWIYQDRSIVNSLVNEFNGGHFELGYRFYPYLEVDLTNYVEDHRFEEIDGSYFSGLQWSSLVSAKLDHEYKSEGLTSGWSVLFSYEETNPVSDFQFWRARVNPVVSVFERGAFNWVITGNASYSPSLPRYQMEELGGSKLRGYDPEEFRDRYFGSIQNDVFLTETNFWKLDLRTFAFADWGFVNSGGRPGAGSGIQIYPQAVAISAFSFYVGYGFNPPGWSTAFSLGKQF